ncbi:MAG: AmmeMemoRadiSam system protein A [Dehalococcoidia bacterium]|nr:AmmeMemoRadiSam system protein A [Dehalococcoidia bacterium]
MSVKKSHPLVELARQSVEMYVRDGEIPRPKALTPEMEEKGGTFISIHKSGQLRGCIGTFQPTRRNVAEEVIYNAINSATGDYRFSPVTPEELPELTYKVDILTAPELVKNKDELDPKKYGVLVEYQGRRGILLPDLPGVDSVDQQIEIASAKGGILPTEPVRIYRFQVRRFEEGKPYPDED